MNLNIDEKILKSFKEKELKVYFYESGCEGTKINFETNFEKDWLDFIELFNVKIFFERKDKENLNEWKIILKIENNWWHSNEDKYIFLSDKIKSRCGCATSFSFENKLIDSNKLKKLKMIFKK